MLVVIGIGGNALLGPDEDVSIDEQRRHLEEAAPSIAEVGDGNSLVVTHGNGPQVGLLAVEQSQSRDGETDTLDILDALTEGEMGYLIARTLGDVMPERAVATLLTQVIVDPADPAFAHPTKPIGPVYSRKAARRLNERLGWSVEERKDGWRRVVPSPEPREIVELPAIEALLENDVVVVCAGGGGIPVVEVAARHVGTSAVIDKDLTTSLLATRLKADTLVLLTDVEAVFSDYRRSSARPIRLASAETLRELELPTGSMGTKVEAAARFADSTGKAAHIGRLADAPAVLSGDSGTSVVPGDAETTWWG